MTTHKQYKLSQRAQRDLVDIWLYISKDNPQAADSVEAEIMRSCQLLAEYPHIGHKREDLTERPLRFWSVYSYMIVYAPDTNPLEIVTIVSGYRDVSGLMQ